MRHLATLTVVLIIVLAALPLPAADNPDAVLGTWLTAPAENGRAKLELRKEEKEGDEVYYGEIVWLEKPIYPEDDEEGMAGKPKVDRENPDPKLRTRSIIGLRLINGFSFDGGDLWAGGTIYDPENGKTYKSKMRLTEDGQILKVRGYIGISLIGRTTQWARVADQVQDSEE